MVFSVQWDDGEILFHFPIPTWHNALKKTTLKCDVFEHRR